MIQQNQFGHQHSLSHSTFLEYISVDEFINYDEEEMEGFEINDHNHESFSPPFTTTDENNSLETSPTEVVNNFYANSHENIYYENHHDIFSFHHVNEIVSQLTTSPRENVVKSSSLDSLEDLNSFEMEEVRDWLAVDDDDHEENTCTSSHNHDQVVLSNVVSSVNVASIKSSLISPTEDMELDHQLGSNHLVKAYTEAIENQNRELVEVIVRRINEKVSPVGEARERLFYHSFHAVDKQADGYMKQESSKVFQSAFEAIYRIVINGMFAHFGANSTILEAMPRDIELLHIVDFDIGEGIQWSSLIVALAYQLQQQQQQHSFGFVAQQMSLKITSIKWKEETSTHLLPQWPFEETKRRLQDYANFHGLKLEVEEIEMEDLVKEMKIKKKIREWLAFNCMWALPHMGRRRSRRRATEFLDVATTLLADFESYGVITHGEGESLERIMNNCSCFGSFFESYMKHYQTLLESMEWSFPSRLAEARVAMESLFVAPYVSSQALHDMWREMRELESVCRGFCQPLLGFGLKVSSERLMEAKVMVREGESLYSVMVEEENNNSNEMVLEWSGTPLVRVFAWRL